nr:acylphosphatase [[Phormidium] sp. ETS-05]
MRCARIFVSGKVQGVFYRVSTQEEAQRKGLSGWVRNLPDGAVEAVFEGTPEAVEDMISWCHIGPRGARVLRVKVESEEPQGLHGFEIKYTAD